MARKSSKGKNTVTCQVHGEQPRDKWVPDMRYACRKCNTEDEKRRRKDDEQYYRDGKRFSYWPGD